MSVSARLVVDPPTFTPSPFGLLTAVDQRNEADVHWRQGVSWDNICGGAGITVDPCVTSAPNITGSGMIQAKAATTGRTLWGATPFTVFAEVDCSPVDFYDNREATMLSVLNHFEGWAVERSFWTGIAPNRNGVGGFPDVVLPHLASNHTVIETLSGRNYNLQQAATVPTGVPLNIVDALGALELGLANCLNGTGIIHVPQSLAPTMALLLQKQGNRLVTPNGNVVSIGAGYPGTGPDGSTPPAGSVWMYATGPIFMYRGAPRMDLMDGAAPLNKSIDLIQAIVERDYVLGYDCCLLAQLVNTASFIATSTTTP